MCKNLLYFMELVSLAEGKNKAQVGLGFGYVLTMERPP